MYIVLLVSLIMVNAKRRIIGGTETDIETYPFAAAMLFSKEDMMLIACGGSIISTVAILSAAHCYYGHPKHDPTKWEARLGSSIPHEGGEGYKIRDFHLNDFENMTKANDLAVVQISGRIKYEYGFIMPVLFANENHVMADGETLIVCGWGRTRASDSFPRILRHAELKYVSNSDCRDAYVKYGKEGLERQPFFTNNMLCAGRAGRGVCFADSGGPLLHGDVLVGVVSWGAKLCNADVPPIFTRVSKYYNWIVNTASALEII